MAWYNNQIYNSIIPYTTIQPLPTLYCNRLGCQLDDLEFLKRELFIEPVTIKYTEVGKELIVYKTAKTKNLKKAKLKVLWLTDGVEDEMLDNLLKSDLDFVNLAKQSEKFDDKAKLSAFFFQ